jgi:hypothetical protein
MPSLSRREDEHLVPAPSELSGQLANVHLYPPGGIPCIWANQDDLHGVQAGWNMCQSAGLAEIARSNSLAIARVRAVTSVRMVPDRSIWIGLPIRTIQPCGVV